MVMIADNYMLQDTNGSPSEFAILLLDQYLRESEKFVAEVAQELAGKE